LLKRLVVLCLCLLLSGALSAKGNAPSYLAEGVISDLTIQHDQASFTLQGAFIVSQGGEEERISQQSVRIQAHINDPFWSASLSGLDSAGLSDPERAFEILREADASKRQLQILLAEPSISYGKDTVSLSGASIVKMTDWEF
jgi:hypothetical protein